MSVLIVLILGILNNQVDVDPDDLATVMFEKVNRKWDKRSYKKFKDYAKLFIENGKRWKVDPVLASCVGLIESRYTEKLILRKKICVTGYYCDSVGKCSFRDKCVRVRVNTNDEGMMQVLWIDRSTKVGFKKCTGKKLKDRKQLHKANPNICIGIYEMAKWKEWKQRTRQNRRLKPISKWNRYFFIRNPLLRKFYYIGFYNWGPRHIGNAYPRMVLLCYQRYMKRLKELQSEREARIRDYRRNRSVQGLTGRARGAPQ
ncbi:MAG: hypothetical protein KAS32_20005 [Candidatus Peribacteraceae bacterium]|nr:hypothetical protein [Candidatus Peribacteraceae bacterium]